MAAAGLRPRAAARRGALGLALALAPLAWFWSQRRHAAPAARLRALTLLTLFLTFDLVLFGAFTRLTDSGLGCPDWPGCYGHASPLGAARTSTRRRRPCPTGPVTHGKAWIEMVHRYSASAIGVLVIALAALAIVERRRAAASTPRRGGPWRRWSGFSPRAPSAR